MTNPSDPNFGAPALLRRFAREVQEMGPRLAQLEFRGMLRELNSPELFDLKIDFPEPAAPPPPEIAPLTDDPVARLMPALNVTLGKIAWVHAPEELPVVGILVPAEAGAELAAAFIRLLTEHHAKPFARLIFLCESLRPIPFLGRYDLSYEHIGPRSIQGLADRVAARYGAVQIRHLVSGTLLWQQSTAE